MHTRNPALQETVGIGCVCGGSLANVLFGPVHHGSDDDRNNLGDAVFIPGRRPPTPVFGGLMWWFIGWLVVLLFTLCLCKAGNDEEEDV